MCNTAQKNQKKKITAFGTSAEMDEVFLVYFASGIGPEMTNFPTQIGIQNIFVYGLFHEQTPHYDRYL